jgi:hypothetical protein
MPRPEVLIADDADNSRVAKPADGLCFVTFSQKQLLAFRAPRLQVIWIAAVFNKADGRLCRLNHVTADHGRDTDTVWSAFDR